MKEQTADKESHDIYEAQAFRELMRSKRRFVMPSVAFLLLFLLSLPVLGSFTSVLEAQLIQGLNWAFVYAYAVFVAPIIVSYLYMRKTKYFDELASKARQEGARGKGEDL